MIRKAMAILLTSQWIPMRKEDSVASTCTGRSFYIAELAYTYYCHYYYYYYYTCMDKGMELKFMPNCLPSVLTL